jgi:hypothetical protein
MPCGCSRLGRLGEHHNCKELAQRQLPYTTKVLRVQHEEGVQQAQRVQLVGSHLWLEGKHLHCQVQ